MKMKKSFRDEKKLQRFLTFALKYVSCQILSLVFVERIQVQQKPLNVITLGQRETNNITQMVTIMNILPVLLRYWQKFGT